MKIKSELPSKVFRWNDGILEQLVTIIQHNKDASHDVGIREEWMKVLVDNKEILYVHKTTIN